MGSTVFEMLKISQVRNGSSRRTPPSPVHTQNAAVLYTCIPVYARLRYEKLDRSNSSRRFPICTAVRLCYRSWCSHWTPSDCPIASRRSLRHVPSCPVECELGFIVTHSVHTSRTGPHWDSIVSLTRAPFVLISAPLLP